MCGRPHEAEELIGCTCARCNKIAGDIDADMLIMSGRDVP